MKFYSKILFVGLGFMFLSSCVKDIKELTEKVNKTNGAIWDLEIALPLLNTSLTMSNIIQKLDNSFVKTDPENVVMIAYRGVLFSQMASEFVKIENQSYSKDFTLSPSQQSYLNSNGSINVQFTEFMDYASGDIEIDSMILKVCNNQLRIQSDFEHNVEFTYSFPELTKDAIPLSVKMIGNYNNSPIDVAQSINMAGYKFVMTTGPKTYNQIKMNIDMKITKVGNNPIGSSDKVTATMYMFYNEYKILYGYVGQNNFMISIDTLKLDVLDKLKGGSFTLDDPRFKIFMHNSLGVPVKADILALKGYSPTAGTINLTGVSNPLPIPVPNYTQVGMTLSDSIVLNKNTSNIATLINSRPSQFIYGVDVTANPAGRSVRNFVVDTSKLTIEVDVEIPLNGTASNITLEEEMDIDFNLDEQTEYLEKVLVRLVLTNGFPIGIDMQVYMLDSSKKIMDSVLVKGDGFLPAAPVNFATGRVINPAKSIVDVEFKQERIIHLKETTSLRIKGVMNTTKNNGNPSPVKIFADYGLGVKLGIQAKIKFNQKF
jgi:hypothetical protein